MDIKINSAESSGNLVTDFYDGHVHEAAFIGICLNHRMAGNNCLKQLINWSSSRTESLRIIVLDYLERHNIHAFNQCSSEEACLFVLKEGDRILQRIHKILSDNKETNVEVLRFYDLLKQKEYQDSIAEIRSLYSNNNKFQADVNKEIKNFIMRIKQSRPQRYKYYDIKETENFINYIIEEIGVYLEIFRQGFKIEIFPGKDSLLLLNLANGKYGEQFSDYKNRTHISIDFDI